MKDENEKWIAGAAVLATLAAGAGFWIIIYLLVGG